MELEPYLRSKKRGADDRNASQTCKDMSNSCQAGAADNAHTGAFLPSRTTFYKIYIVHFIALSHAPV